MKFHIAPNITILLVSLLVSSSARAQFDGEVQPAIAKKHESTEEPAVPTEEQVDEEELDYTPVVDGSLTAPLSPEELEPPPEAKQEESPPPPPSQRTGSSLERQPEEKPKSREAGEKKHPSSSVSEPGDVSASEDKSFFGLGYAKLNYGFYRGRPTIRGERYPDIVNSNTARLELALDMGERVQLQLHTGLAHTLTGGRNTLVASSPGLIGLFKMKSGPVRWAFSSAFLPPITQAKSAEQALTFATANGQDLAFPLYAPDTTVLTFGVRGGVPLSRSTLLIGRISYGFAWPHVLENPGQSLFYGIGFKQGIVGPLFATLFHSAKYFHYTGYQAIFEPGLGLQLGSWRPTFRMSLPFKGPDGSAFEAGKYWGAHLGIRFEPKG